MISTGGTTTLGLYDNKSDIQKLQQDLAYEVSRSTAIDASLAENKADKNDTYTKAEVDSSITAVAGGHKAYQTLSAAQAAQSTLPANSIVEVTNDPTASNNGIYQWNGTTLTKSTYDPLTQAKAYTTDVLANGLTQEIYKTTLTPDAPNPSGLSSTVVFTEQAVAITGIVSKVYANLTPQVSALFAIVFDLVGSNYVQSSNSPVVINAEGTEHTLVTPLKVENGQFIGFYCAGGMPYATNATAKTHAYEIGSATSVPITQTYNSVIWQLYFIVNSHSIASVSENLIQNAKNITINSQNITSVIASLGTESETIGADMLSGGSSSANIEYVPYATKMKKNGWIHKAEFNLLVDDVVSFFVARKQPNNSYLIIAESPPVSYPAGINTAILSGLDYQKDDLIGWSAAYKKVIFDHSILANSTSEYCAISKTNNTFLVNQVLNLSQPRVKFTLYEFGHLKMTVLTQSQYDTLEIKDQNTLYGVIQT